MYPNHNQGAHGHAHGQGPAHHWQHPSGSQQPPTNAAYSAQPPHPAHINTSLPPPPQEPRPDMAGNYHPQQQQQQQQQQQPAYQLPGPAEWQRGPPPNPYAAHPPQPQYHGHQPPAPRQRTAIACRYCRRRKIRCSGFEATEDGRCSNCLRFNQDCIFTPVSAQTQAFVPAHTVWRGVGQPPPMYGAYGQPLPPATHAGPSDYAQAPPRQPQQYLPSPTAAPGPYQASSFGPPLSGSPYSDPGRESNRKRSHEEPHTPTLPRPNPASSSRLSVHGGSAGQGYTYPDPTSLTTSAVSPASSATSYHSAPPAPATQPYYATQPPRRSSPQSAYSSEAMRASSSPHTRAAPATPSAGPYYAAPPPARNDGRTPPPPTGSGTTRPGMSINDLVSGDQSNNGPTRSTTDSNMLNQLNRRPM